METRKINEQALLALPFIGLWLGVDDLVPSRSVYGIYDPGNAALRYTLGDGTLITAEQVCFSTKYKDSNMPLNRSQRLHFEALIAASIKHYATINSGNPQLEHFRNRFPSVNDVKRALTFRIDSANPQNNCPALQGLPKNDQPIHDNAAPSIEISSDPIWNFDPQGFQAYPTRDLVNELRRLYFGFQKNYHSPLSLKDFQHATFCLAGLEKANLISFILEDQNNPRLDIAGQTPELLPKPHYPLETAKRWTVECFLARFHHWQQLFKPGNFVRYPNPILWLEAELEVEEMLFARGNEYQLIKPWKGKVDNLPVEPVIDWDTLKSLEWETRGNFNQYPKPYDQSKVPQPSHEPSQERSPELSQEQVEFMKNWSEKKKASVKGILKRMIQERGKLARSADKEKGINNSLETNDTPPEIPAMYRRSEQSWLGGGLYQSQRKRKREQQHTLTSPWAGMNIRPYHCDYFNSTQEQDGHLQAFSIGCDKFEQEYTIDSSGKRYLSCLRSLSLTSDIQMPPHVYGRPDKNGHRATPDWALQLVKSIEHDNCNDESDQETPRAVELDRHEQAASAPANTGFDNLFNTKPMPSQSFTKHSRAGGPSSGRTIPKRKKSTTKTHGANLPSNSRTIDETITPKTRIPDLFNTAPLGRPRAPATSLHSSFRAPHRGGIGSTSHPNKKSRPNRSRPSRPEQQSAMALGTAPNNSGQDFDEPLVKQEEEDELYG